MKIFPRLLLALGLLLLVVSSAHAQMDLSQVSGQPLPAPDVPVGTMTIRVIRGAITNNVPNQPVEVTIDGVKQTVTTDASGRTQVTGLKSGSRIKAATVVDGERVESKDITYGSSGIRLMLVAGLTGAAKPGAAPAAPAGPPIKGTVAFGPESRIVAEFVDDRLNLYYLLDVVNAASSPVDTGGPLIVELPGEARGATLMQDSSKQATVSGSHVTILGPFAPGTTSVRVAFELPASGGTAHVTSKLPAALPHLIVIAGQVGGVDLVSSQITAKRELNDEGQRIIVGTGNALQAGQTLQFDITGLPHHATWPRYLALTLAASIMTAGIWAAVVANPRGRRA